MVDYPIIKIDVFTDAGLKRNECYRIGTVFCWDDLKTIIVENINGKTIKDSTTEFALVSLKIHLYNEISTIDYKQDQSGHYTLIFRCFADAALINAVTTFINETVTPAN